jgi:hypothetical protein
MTCKAGKPRSQGKGDARRDNLAQFSKNLTHVKFDSNKSTGTIKLAKANRVVFSYK